MVVVGLTLASAACGPSAEGEDDATMETGADTPVTPRDGDRMADAEVASTGSPEDVTWRLLTLRGGPVEPPAEGRAIRFIVLESERPGVTGFAGCNRIAGSYTLEGASLTFSEIVATRMACPDGVEEQALLDALAATTGWTISTDGRLLLRGSDGATLATFADEGRPLAE
jgi:heat shock protein HslJ